MVVYGDAANVASRSLISVMLSTYNSKTTIDLLIHSRMKRTRLTPLSQARVGFYESDDRGVEPTDQGDTPLTILQGMGSGQSRTPPNITSVTYDHREKGSPRRWLIYPRISRHAL
jgi:hypothetical protein